MRTAIPIAVAIMAAMTLACPPRVPVPPEGSHEGEMPIKVPHPPPPPRVEEVPPQPRPHTVWLDGHWRWKNGAYVWKTGGWVLPAKNMQYAPATILRLRNGELLYYEPRWKRAPAEGD